MPLTANGENGVRGPSAHGRAAVERPSLNASATAPDRVTAVGTAWANGGGTNCATQR